MAYCIAAPFSPLQGREHITPPLAKGGRGGGHWPRPRPSTVTIPSFPKKRRAPSARLQRLGQWPRSLLTPPTPPSQGGELYVSPCQKRVGVSAPGRPVVRNPSVNRSKVQRSTF